MSDTPTRAIADLVVKLQLEDIPPAVVERAKLHILDGLGLALASTREDFGTSAAAGIVAMSGTGPCSVIGRTERLPPRDASMLNAILLHGLDFDDTHLASIIHPTCTALPAALALGEALGKDGGEVLAAFITGAEVGIRIGAAIDGGFHHVGFHATGVVAHFASAVTAGMLLGLTVDQLQAALGTVGSTASGIQVFLEEGAWTKRFHPGWGAVAGITAAYLARHGFTGPSRPLEGKFGLIETHLQDHASGYRPERLTEGLGSDWRFGETALKPYPVCHFIHGCADAAIALHREIAGAEIATVEAFLPQPTLHIVAEPAHGKQRPGNEYEVKFSAQFVTAYCLLHGRFDLSDLLPGAMADPAARALAQRVTCAADPQSAFPEYFSGGVRVVLADGRTLSHHVRVNSGAGANAMNSEQVQQKFLACAGMAIPAEQARRVWEAAMALDFSEALRQTRPDA